MIPADGNIKQCETCNKRDRTIQPSEVCSFVYTVSSSALAPGTHCTGKALAISSQLWKPTDFTFTGQKYHL